MMQLTLEMADRVVKAAFEKARELGTPMTISVVDAGGHLVLCARGDGTGFFSPDTSRAKAVAAAAFRRSTREMAELHEAGSAFWSTVPSLLQGQVLPSTGGLPLVVEGEVIGGIGCGGGHSGEQDHLCAEAGAAAILDL